MMPSGFSSFKYSLLKIISNYFNKPFNI